MSNWLSIALRPRVLWRAAGYGIVVGAILIGINHGDAIARGDFDKLRIIKMILTPFVPFGVSMLSSVGAIRNAEKRLRR